LCVDEDPLSAVKKNITYASMVHMKDFYRRSATYNPGEGWFRSAYGNYLRGAIVGHGDMNIPEIVKIVKQSGNDSLPFYRV
jgi:inosose dehydratase